MQRSLDHAAAGALRDLMACAPGAADQRPVLLARWGLREHAVFFADNHETMGDSPAWAADDGERDGLTRCLSLARRPMSVTYELKHRPAWAIIPTRALLALAGLEPSTEEA